MKKLKRIVSAICVALTLLCCVGCVEADIGIAIDEEGVASMAYKISIEKRLYDELLSHANENSNTQEPSEETDAVNENVSDTSEQNPSPNSVNTVPPNLTEYVEEIIDGNIYYSYTFARKEYGSYEDLAAELRTMEVLPGIPLFSIFTLSNENCESFTFYIKTTEISSDTLKNATSLISVPDHWMLLTLTVSMPGVIDENRYNDGVDMTDLGEKAVRYTISDLTQPNEIFVHASLVNDYKIPFVMTAIVTACVIMALIFAFGKGDKKNSQNEAEI